MVLKASVQGPVSQYHLPMGFSMQYEVFQINSNMYYTWHLRALLLESKLHWGPRKPAAFHYKFPFPHALSPPPLLILLSINRLALVILSQPKPASRSVSYMGFQQLINMRKAREQLSFVSTQHHPPGSFQMLQPHIIYSSQARGGKARCAPRIPATEKCVQGFGGAASPFTYVRQREIKPLQEFMAFL